jgi:hypothetical protein
MLTDAESNPEGSELSVANTVLALASLVLNIPAAGCSRWRSGSTTTPTGTHL